MPTEKYRGPIDGSIHLTKEDIDAMFSGNERKHFIIDETLRKSADTRILEQRETLRKHYNKI